MKLCRRLVRGLGVACLVLGGILSSVGLTQSILNSSYHGLQITGDKRFSRNFNVKGFYTFGKGLDYINTQNSTQQTATDWNNIALDRGRTNNDRRHNAVIPRLVGEDRVRIFRLGAT